jgi:hypothetical protein
VIGVRAAVILALCAVAASAAPGVAQPSEQDTAILAALDKRFRDYHELHEKLEATLPPLSTRATPHEIDAHQRALAALIHKARPAAARGNTFGPGGRAFVRRTIADALSGPEGPALAAAMRDDNPGRINLRINGRLPSDLPRSIVPPRLLQVLPPLPASLEYRVIGDRLALIDVHANTVVDYISNALPD